MMPASEIEEGLQVIRVRQKRMGHVLMGLIPFALVASVLPSGLEIPFVVAAVVYGALLLAYSFRLAFTDCPRCHRYYHWKLWSDPWTQKCLHCGLPLKAKADGKQR